MIHLANQETTRDTPEYSTGAHLQKEIQETATNSPEYTTGACVQKECWETAWSTPEYTTGNSRQYTFYCVNWLFFTILA